MKKIFSLLLVAMLLVSAMPVAYAAFVECPVCESTEQGWIGECGHTICGGCNYCPTCNAADTQDYTMGTAVEYTAANNTAYTITVPAELQPGQSGTVTLKGMWASDQTVKVTADANVELTNSINAADKHTLAITFLGIEKAGDNTVEKTYTETVSVANMPANALFGVWSGKFNYNVEYVEPEAVELITFTLMPKSGDHRTFQAEKGMTWEQWVDNEEYSESAYIEEYNGRQVVKYLSSVISTNGEEDGAVSPAEPILEGTTYEMFIIGGGRV